MTQSWLEIVGIISDRGSKESFKFAWGLLHIKVVLETARGSAAIFDSKVADTEPEAKVPFDSLVVVY